MGTRLCDQKIPAASTAGRLCRPPCQDLLCPPNGTPSEQPPAISDPPTHTLDTRASMRQARLPACPTHQPHTPTSHAPTHLHAHTPGRRLPSDHCRRRLRPTAGPPAPRPLGGRCDTHTHVLFVCFFGFIPSAQARCIRPQAHAGPSCACAAGRQRQAGRCAMGGCPGRPTGPTCMLEKGHEDGYCLGLPGLLGAHAGVRPWAGGAGVVRPRWRGSWLARSRCAAGRTSSAYASLVRTASLSSLRAWRALRACRMHGGVSDRLCQFYSDRSCQKQTSDNCRPRWTRLEVESPSCCMSSSHPPIRSLPTSSSMKSSSRLSMTFDVPMVHTYCQRASREGEARTSRSLLR